MSKEGKVNTNVKDPQVFLGKSKMIEGNSFSTTAPCIEHSSSCSLSYRWHLASLTESDSMPPGQNIKSSGGNQ